MEIVSSLMLAVPLCNEAAQGYFAVVMVQERHDISDSITISTVQALHKRRSGNYNACSLYNLLGRVFAKGQNVFDLD